jgi:hypothetical protein
MRTPRRIGAFLFFFALPIFTACNNDKTKKEVQGPASAEPIPTDLVYNSFFDDKNAATNAVIVSPDGGALAMDAAVASSGSTAKLESAGADPKSPLVYAFSTKTRNVTATLKITQTTPQGSADQTFKVSFSATPKPKFATSGDATVDMKIAKLELQLPPNAPPQAAAQKDQLEKAMVGITGHFDVSSHGEISDPSFETDKAAQGAAEMTQIIQQALELLVVPTPNEAVGVGAKWSKHESKNLADEGTSISGNVTMTLMARDAQTATIKVEATNSGTMAVNDPRAPKGTSVQRNSTSSFTVIVRLDGVAQKIDGQSKNDIVQKVPGQPDQAMNVTISQNIESK